MAATLTTLDKLLKDLYLPRLTGQFYKQTPVLSRVKRRAEGVEFVGRKALIALVAGRNEAVGARAEAAATPTAGNMEVSNAEVAMKYVYGSVKITGQTIAASKRSEGAFSRALTLEMEGIKESLMYDLGRQVSYGDGTGVLAMTNGSGSSATSLIVDNPGVNFLRKNMVIDVYTATSGGSQELNSITITAVNTSTNTCTVASSTWSDNSYVFREDARGQEVMGLGGVVDNGGRLATLQGIDRTAAGNEYWKSNVLSNSGVNRALTLRLVDDAYLESEKNGGGSYPTAIYSRHVHAQAYAELLRNDRRLAPKDMVLNGGWRAVEYTGMGGTCPWIVDRSQRANEILFVNEDDLLWLEEEPLQWLGQSQGSPILRPALDSSDAYEAKLLTYCNLGTRRGNGHTRLGDISESAA